MANPVLGKFLCSDWFLLGQNFAVRTVFMETVQPVYFCFGAKPANSKFATKTAKKKLWILSFFTVKLPEEAKKIEKLKRLIAPEVHFTIRNRMPYNKQLTNRACSGRTGGYWPSVVEVRTERSEVRTATTSGNIPQYGPCARLVSG